MSGVYSMKGIKTINQTIFEDYNCDKKEFLKKYKRAILDIHCRLKVSAPNTSSKIELSLENLAILDLLLNT